jgi:bifunctional enzyme Fae/Hps
MNKRSSRLSSKKHYLQIALNSTVEDARNIIRTMPFNDRIIIEAGTPLIKKYGIGVIHQINNWYLQRLGMGNSADDPENNTLNDNSNAVMNYMLKDFFKGFSREKNPIKKIERPNVAPYIVADLKTMDRGETEVAMAAHAGASAVVALGSAPVETLNAFMENCERYNVDAMIDMMNVEYPISVLSSLKKIPPVVILHRGVDEEAFNKEKRLPLHEIQRIKGTYDTMISVAGGDTNREIQSSVFNGADIVVVWKSVYQSGKETVELIENFLKEIK